MNHSVPNIVTNFLIKENYIQKNDKIDITDSLLELGIIDSVGIINLVSLLEETYDIQIDDEDLMPENFDTLSAIEKYVQEKLS